MSLLILLRNSAGGGGGGVPTINSSSISIGRSYATVNANITTNGSDTTVYVLWGFTDSYGYQSTTSVLTDSGSGQPLAFTLFPLKPGTLYNYSIVAINGSGQAP
jgi:hypothetical protein